MNPFRPPSNVLSIAFVVAIVATSAVGRAQVTPAIHPTSGTIGSVVGEATFGSATGGLHVRPVGARGGAHVGAVRMFDADAAAVALDLSVAAQREKLHADEAVDASASAALDAGRTVRVIHHYSADSRQQLVNDIDERVDASAVALARLHRQMRTFEGEVSAEFTTAAKAVEEREDQLRKSLEAASNVSADSWADARAAVAADYAAYAAAVARAEAAAQANLVPPVSLAPSSTQPMVQPAPDTAAPSTTTVSAGAPRPPAP